MKWLAAALAVAVILLQYRVWISADGVREVERLKRAVATQRADNEQLAERNRQLAAEVRDLKTGMDALEERARSDLGMIARNETFYQVVPARPADTSQSVRLALTGLEGRAGPDDWVLVHDAARPCLDAHDLERLLGELGTHPLGGLLAIPATDTLKRAQSGAGTRAAVAQTLDRSGLWRGLTPAVFRSRPAAKGVGSVRIPHSRGVVAHSDGDVMLHALCDALLGAAGLGDIGQHFSDTDPQWQGADSRRFVVSVLALLHARRLAVANVDLTVLAQA